MNESDLIEAAITVRENAYAPFSKYAVGAALFDAEGRLFTGCNVENSSYGASICAERAAIFKMVSEGGQRITKMAVVTADGGVPCGMCLQVIREFVDNPGTLDIWCVGGDRKKQRFTLRELLPVQFGKAGN